MRTTRKLAAAVAVAILLASIGVLVGSSSQPAVAHGAQLFPGSRQFFCWVDGLQDDGQIFPANPACQDAVAQAGTTHLFNWFANLHPAAAGQTVGFIPDGRICDGGGGGPFNFEPYNMARLDWPRTHLTAGDTYEFQHNNWADHPGRFDVWHNCEDRAEIHREDSFVLQGLRGVCEDCTKRFRGQLGIIRKKLLLGPAFSRPRNRRAGANPDPDDSCKQRLDGRLRALYPHRQREVS